MQIKNNMKAGFLITGRMKSTRLPKKLTLEVLDREMIAWMIDRAKLCKGVDEIVIATSTNPQDDILEEIAIREGVKIFRGSEADVVERLYEAAKAFDLDFFVNITADCPLFGYDYVDKTIEEYKKTNADLITSMKLPHGLFVYGIKTEAFKKVIEMKKISDTEVWGALLYENQDIFNIVDMETPKELEREHFRLTLDYPEDFDLFNTIYQKIGKETYKKNTKEIIDFLDEHPEIVEINQSCRDVWKKKFNQQESTMLKSK